MVPSNTDEAIQSLVGFNYVSMIFNSLSAGGTGVGISLLFMIYEVVVIILRFLNIGLVNLKIKIFLGIVSKFDVKVAKHFYVRRVSSSLAKLSSILTTPA